MASRLFLGVRNAGDQGVRASNKVLTVLRVEAEWFEIDA